MTPNQTSAINTVTGGKELSSGEFSAMRLRDDNPSRVDMLGFSDIVAAIESTITRQDLDPVTVGVNAPWGGGKTTVLRLLEDQLASRQDVLVVVVSPWEYDRLTDVKVTLIESVLNRLEGQARGDESTLDKATRHLKALKNRVNVAKAMKLVATSALTMTIPGISSLGSIFNADEAGSDLTLQGFREQFHAFLAEDGLSHVCRVVVLIDDLDRSLPDTVVESLEAIKLFLSVDRMAFVIAADEENIARAIGQRLKSTGQPTTARQYLEKIVQIPFRIPALTLELTEEYLALLLLGNEVDTTSVINLARATRENGPTLSVRIDSLVPAERKSDVELAERLAPVLHRHTQGNPRRLKRFLNAMWLRTAFARVRGVELEADACAKLMIAELMYPDFFSQLLGWLSSGSLMDEIAELETGSSDQAEQIVEWAQLPPSLGNVDVSAYLLLAASLRSETVEGASLPPELRVLADQLTNDSNAIRDGAISEARVLPTAPRSTLARFVAAQLRLQRSPERQMALAQSISGLSTESAVARTAVEELILMEPQSILTPVPLALLAKNKPPELIELVQRWSSDPSISDRTRTASLEALEAAQ